MTGLTTHVLDTSAGVPARGVAITLFEITGDGRKEITSSHTNRDGRTDRPLIAADAMHAGTFEIIFDIGAYFETRGHEHQFLGQVPVRFHISDPTGHYHVPLLASPWSYTTYRGS